MNLLEVKWFEVILKTKSGFVFEKVVADSMKSACRIADEMFGKGVWEYVTELN